MKRNLLLILLVAGMLSACSAVGQPSATALPTVILGGGNTSPTLDSSTPAPSQPDITGGGVTASGVVVPARQARLAFPLVGRIETITVAAGDQVKAGQILAELDYFTAYAQAGQAGSSLKELTSPASIAAAERDLATARQTLKDTQNKADSMLFPRASQALIDNTQAEIDLAKQQLARASDAYRPLSRLPEGDSKKASALIAMTNAQLNLNRLIAQYNWYTSKPSDIDAALARANLAAAKAALQEAEWYVAALKGEQVPADATGSRLAELEQARERLALTRLVSPIPGTVASVNGAVGEMASPGAVFIVVSDVARLQVETTDLSERDVSQVKVGQAVTVLIKALNENATGHVVIISPVADTLGGDVVYKTVIDLDLPLPEGLRAGMSVDVRFEAGP